MRSPQKIDPDEWVDAETARAMLGGVAARTLRQMVADCRITRVVRPGPKQTRLYYKPDIISSACWRCGLQPYARKTKARMPWLCSSKFSRRCARRIRPGPSCTCRLEEAAAYAGLPAPFLLRLVAERKLACWKTDGPSETGEGYFFARAELEELRPGVESAG